VSDDRHQTHECLDAETLAAFIDGRLEPRARAAVEAHLAECEDCYEVWMEAGREPRAGGAPRKGSSISRTVAIALAATTVLMAGYSWLAWTRQTPEASLDSLARVVGSNRFAVGRLATPFAYGAPPSGIRGGPPREWPLAVQQQIVTLKLQAEKDRSVVSLHRAGVALFVEGSIDAAIEALEGAVALQADDPVLRVDVSAAYIQRATAGGSSLDAARALDHSLAALRLDPSRLDARFNAAIAAEIVGPKSEAQRRWAEYLALDETSLWASEGRTRLEEISREPAPFEEGSVFGLSRRVRDVYLVNWAKSVVDGSPFDWTPVDEALAGLATQRPARRAQQILAAVRHLPPQGDVGRCWATAILQHMRWRQAFEHERYSEAESALESFRRGQTCPGDYRLDLELDHAFTTSALTGLADGIDNLLRQLKALTASGYFREAAQITILAGLRALRQVNFDEGRGYYEACISLAESGGEWDVLAWCKARLADVLDELGQPEDAWGLALEALVALPAVHGPRRLYLVLSPMVIMAERAGMKDLTFTLAELTLTMTRDWESPAALIFAHGRRARATNDWNDITSRQELASARAALSKIADTTRRQVQSFELSLLEAELHIATQPRKAIDELSRGISFVESRNNWYRTSKLLHLRGLAHLADGNEPAAEADWQRSAVLVAGQASLMESTELRVSRLDHAWEVFDNLLRVQRRRPLAALATADWSHARDLSAAISDMRPVGPTDPTSVQKLLTPGTTVIVYAALSDRLLVWSVTRSDIRPFEFPVGVGQLSRMVDAMVRDLHAGVETDDGGVLFDLLVPREALLGTTTLIVVPTGPLSVLPFAALLDSTGKRLIERVDLGAAPSLSVLGVAARVSWSPSLGPVVLLAAGAARPELGLGRLPGTEEDARIARAVYGAERVVVLSGENGFRRFQGAAASAGLLQFSGHAVLDLRRPSDSRLLFSGSPDHDLRLSDLENMRIVPGALVFLNACETAAGRRFKGEGAISLSRPFLAAGASGVVGSLWRVADLDAIRFGAAFHARLKSMHPLRAVADAQRELLASGRPAIAWAGFLYSGGF